MIVRPSYCNRKSAVIFCDCQVNKAIHKIEKPPKESERNKMSFFSSMIWIALSFLFFTVMVAVISAWKTRDDKLDTAEGYFLAGRGLPGIVIAGSLLLTNLSAEQLVGTNGQGWASNMSPIGWEVGALFTLFALALWFLPTYLKMGTTTIPQLMEARFGRGTKLMFSFVIVVMYSILNLPVILYSGAVVFENIFDISGIFGIGKFQAVAILCVVIGIIGGCYAIFGGLKAVAVSDTINGIGLIIGGLMIPFLALALLGHETTGGGLVEGVKYLVQAEPEKLNAWASWDAAEPALPWPLIFTGMFFNNLYWWCTNQSFVQRALAAKSLKEGQKGAIYCGFLKTIGFFYLVLPGVIAYHLPSIQDKLAAAGSSAIDFAYPALVSAVVRRDPVLVQLGAQFRIDHLYPRPVPNCHQSQGFGYAVRQGRQDLRHLRRCSRYLRGTVRYVRTGHHDLPQLYEPVRFPADPVHCTRRADLPQGTEVRAQGHHRCSRYRLRRVYDPQALLPHLG